MSDWVASWPRCVGYAMSNAQKRWREDGNEGDPPVVFLLDWLPYYLAQQDSTGMLPARQAGSL